MKAQEVFGLWAEQPEGSKKSAKSGNVSFNGPYAYSYNAVIGYFVDSPEGRTYFVSTRKHSVTTSKHQNALRRAIPEGATVKEVTG